MPLPVVVIELGSQLALARDLAAGRVFVPGCALAIESACELVIRGVPGEAMKLGARVVYVDAPGAGLQIVDFTTPKRTRLAELVAAVTEAASHAESLQRTHGPVFDAPTTRGTVETAVARTTSDELVLEIPSPAPPPPLLDRRPPSVAPPIRQMSSSTLAIPPDLTPADPDEFEGPTTFRKVDRGFAKPVAPPPIPKRAATAPPAPDEFEIDLATVPPSKAPTPLEYEIDLETQRPIPKDRSSAAIAVPPVEPPAQLPPTQPKTQPKAQPTTMPLARVMPEAVTPIREVLHRKRPPSASPETVAIGSFELEAGTVRPAPAPLGGANVALPFDLAAELRAYVESEEQAESRRAASQATASEVAEELAMLELAPEPTIAPDILEIAELDLADDSSARGSSPDLGLAGDADDTDDDRKPIPKNIHERLRGLSMAEQVKTAHSADPQERIALERIYGKNVWEPLLRNPRLTAPEVVRLARMGTMPRVLVEVIVSNGAWIAIPEVRRALLTNPRLGADQIPRVLRAMPKHELKLCATQAVYPMAVREAAKRLVRGG